MSIFQSNEVFAAERISYSIDKRTNSNTTVDLKSKLEKNIFEAPALKIEGQQENTFNLDSSNRLYIGNPKLKNQISTNSHIPIFSIFDASVNLIHDEDGDNYYHHFSVNFDADIDAGSAIVFARMYISYEGGPWNQYYTTKTFEIYGDEDIDSHTVETIFTTGYESGNYDIRIDLYEAGWSGRVAVRGPYEDYDLNYVPLEDEEHDYVASYPVSDVDIITTDSGGGCTLNSNSKFDPIFLIMFLASLLYLLRGNYNRKRDIKYEIINQET
jgi:hypothetical protein